MENKMLERKKNADIVIPSPSKPLIIDDFKVVSLIRERTELRKEMKWDLADDIQNMLLKHGIVITDFPRKEGGLSTWERVVLNVPKSIISIDHLLCFSDIKDCCLSLNDNNIDKLNAIKLEIF